MVNTSIWNTSGSGVTITDGPLNTYKPVYTVGPINTNAYMHQYQTRSAAGGSITITVDPTGASADIDFNITEFADVEGSGFPVWASATGNAAVGSGAGSMSAITPSAGFRNSALISNFHYSPDNGRTMTPLAGWTQIDENENNSTGMCFNTSIIVKADDPSPVNYGGSIGAGAASTTIQAGCGIYSGAIRRRA